MSGRSLSLRLRTGANAPALGSVEALAGRKVFVRRSSSYYESLAALNTRLQAAGKPPVQIKLADEHLEDEDILELAHAGVVPITVVDAYIAKLWAPVLPNIRVRDDLIVRKDAHRGPIVRKDSAELRKALAAFMKTHGPGTTFGNVVIQRYARDNRWVRNPGATEGKCHRCKFVSDCRGCRALAFAEHAKVMAEDSTCQYIPGE